MHSIVKPEHREKKKKRNKSKKIKIIGRETRFIRLRTLSCFPDIHGQILDGWTMAEIAKYIQEEKKEYTDIQRSSLIQLLDSYRSSIPKGELISRRIPTFLNNVKNEISKQKDTLTELWKLYDIQVRRIERVLEQEENFGVNIPTVDNTIKIAQGIVESIHEIQSDLGITPRHLGTVGVDTKIATMQISQPQVAEVLQNPVSRNKVLTIAERIIALSADSNSLQSLTSLLPHKEIPITGVEKNNTKVIDSSESESVEIADTTEDL